MLFFPPGLMKRAAVVGSLPVTVQRVALGGSGSGSTVSSSFLPGASKLLLAGGAYRRAGSSATVPLATLNDSLATPLVWTQVADVDQSLVSPTSQRSTLWWAQAPAVPSSMTVTLAQASAANLLVSVYELDNAQQDFANIGTGKSSTGDPAATLGTAPAADSLLFALAGCTLSESLGAAPPASFLDTPAGFTSLYNVTRANGTAINPIAAEVAVRTPADVSSVAWVSAGFIATALLVELKRV